jgi:hypothetical protein
VCKSTVLSWRIIMGGFKDKDLIKDNCGLTKHREYG